MRLPMKGQEVDLEVFKKMIDTFMEKGFPYFDTSYVYHNGDSEKVIKEALVERYPRDSFTITTKSPIFMIQSQEHLKSVFKEQLQRLGTDYVDYYWIHAIKRDGYEKIKTMELMRAMMELKESGKVKHVGMSYHDSPELLDETLTTYPEIEYVQLQLNYFDWDSPYVVAKECYEVCCKHNRPVAVMEPIKGGQLIHLPEELKKKFTDYNAEASMASWAIRYAASLDNVYVVLSGMSDMEQMRDNASFMENFEPLNEKECRIVDEVAQRLRNKKVYPEQELKEAEQECPKNIGIVKIAQMMNDHLEMDGYTNTTIYYNAYLNGQASAAACDRCGKCLSKSRKIDIPDMLEKADATITHF